MISVRNISKDYGSGPVFENVNLEVNKGESVVIIGGSGCGKSTLLRCINGLVIPEKGEILIDGEDILAKGADIDSIRRKMGMVYQHFNLFSHLNILENMILAPMKVANKSRSEAVDEARMLLEKVGMGGRETAMPKSLSGGQKQRVAIARTLAMHPEVILFDEPTSALDPTMVDEVENVIRSLVNDGMTSIIVTHEMNFARNIATKVIFMAEKGIYEQGTPKEVFDNPSKSLTRKFLYRSRMLEEELKAESLDLYSLSSNLTAFINQYETTPKQKHLISAICDELLYPLFKAETSPAKKAFISVLCSETGSSHTIRMILEGLESDPMQEPYLDDLNVRILENYSAFIFSKKVDSGWEICIQM